MNKKAIVFARFPYESTFGGEESHTLSLARYFQKQGYEPIFFGSCKILLQKFVDEGFTTKKVWGGKMIVTPFELLKSFFLFPFIQWNLKKEFQKLCEQYDVRACVFLSLNEKLFLTPGVVERGISVTWIEHQEIRNWLIKNPWNSLYKKYSHNVMTVPIGKKNKEMLINRLHISPKGICEIVNGVQVHELSQLLRRTKKNLIVTASRDIPKKGIDDFREAINLLKRNNLDIRIMTDFLKKENWYDLLSEADVYVLPSRDQSETFSLNAAEALAAGCKVVVTACSGIVDYLEDKKNAFLVEPMNPKDLARGIEQALDASEDIRDAARKVAQEKFDQERMFQEYESVILRS